MSRWGLGTKAGLSSSDLGPSGHKILGPHLSQDTDTSDPGPAEFGARRVIAAGRSFTLRCPTAKEPPNDKKSEGCVLCVLIWSPDFLLPAPFFAYGWARSKLRGGEVMPLKVISNMPRAKAVIAAVLAISEHFEVMRRGIEGA